MKSVFKTVAPIAMTITFALSGVAMADTATTAAKSADSAKMVDSAVTTATETVKSSAHHLHKVEEKKLEQADAKNTVAAATVEKLETAKKVATDKALVTEKNALTEKTVAIEKTGATDKAVVTDKIASAESAKKSIEPTKAK